jgi:hypothetical protein
MHYHHIILEENVGFRLVGGYLKAINEWFTLINIPNKCTKSLLVFLLRTSRLIYLIAVFPNDAETGEKIILLPVIVM